jgi:hypothetical protein
MYYLGGKEVIMNIQKMLAIIAILGTLTSSNAFRIENYDRKDWAGTHRYVAYHFTKDEADRLKAKMNAINLLASGAEAAIAGALVAASIAAPPVAAGIAAIMIGVQGMASGVLEWTTHKGTGFAIHAPIKCGTGMPCIGCHLRVPFTWESDG